MDNITAREKAGKAASRRREENLEITHHADIPKDIKFATLEDLEDLKADNFTVVPIIGKSGNVHNWLLRRLKAGERSALHQSMFPKNVLNKIKNQALGGKKSQKSINIDDLGMSIEEMEAASFRRDCLTIKKSTVFPEGVTVEDIENLEIDDFDRLLEASNIDVNIEDDVSRFHTDGGLDTGESENGEPVEDTEDAEE